MIHWGRQIVAAPHLHPATHDLPPIPPSPPPSMPAQYFVRVVSDEWLGAQFLLPVPLRHLTLPQRQGGHTGEAVACIL